MKIAFIVNSKVRKLQKFQSQFDQSKHELKEDSECFYTQFPQHATDLAARILEFDVVVAVGGDGTLHEVINGVLSPAVETGRSLPVVGLLPFGTANDFARVQNISNTVDGLFDLVAQKFWRNIDAGEILHSDGSSWFINIADAGFGGEVVQRMKSGGFIYNKMSSKIKFVSAITRSFISYKKEVCRIVVDDFSWEGKLLSVVVANSTTFGSGLQIAPNASIISGGFEVVVIGNITMLEYLRFLPKIRRGEIIIHPEVQYLTSQKVEIESDHVQHMEADGELIGTLPCKIICHPGKIRFVVP